jgi:hypothetical protein
MMANIGAFNYRFESNSITQSLYELFVFDSVLRVSKCKEQQIISCDLPYHTDVAKICSVHFGISFVYSNRCYVCRSGRNSKLYHVTYHTTQMSLKSPTHISTFPSSIRIDVTCVEMQGTANYSYIMWPTTQMLLTSAAYISTFPFSIRIDVPCVEMQGTTNYIRIVAGSMYAKSQITQYLHA